MGMTAQMMKETARMALEMAQRRRVALDGISASRKVAAACPTPPAFWRRSESVARSCCAGQAALNSVSRRKGAAVACRPAPAC